MQPSSNQGSHLLAFLPPFVHQRGGSEGGYSGPCGQECGGACSSAFPGLLQPAFRSVEDLRVLETCHRSLDPQSLRGCVALPHGDHPVCPSLCSSGRLDGLHRPQGSLPAGPCPSGLSELPSVCGSGQCLPILCPLLWPLHGSTGLLTGHGSCFRHSPSLGYPHEAVPRRLASPVVLSRVSPSRPQGGPRSLPRTGDCSESSEVSPRSFPGSPVSRGGGGLTVFPGIFITGTRRQASVNSQSISLLRRSSSEYLALTARHTVLSLPLRKIEITVDKVKMKLKKLNSNKSAGPDGFYPRVIKETEEETAPHFCNIFRTSLEQRKAVRDWKLQNISPLFKKGSKDDPGNYRPISLTSVPGKMLESIIADDMMSHLEYNKLILDSQHGF